MKSSVSITIRSRVPQVKAQLYSRLARVVQSNAHLWQGLARFIAPVDTGFLQNSIEAIPTLDPLVWMVAVYANYGIFVEFGTVYANAQPFMRPSAIQVESNFYAELFEAMRGVK